MFLRGVLFFVIECLYFSQAQEKIVGGIAVEGKERPSFMAVFNFIPGSAVKCTCSIISRNFIISAAHCLSSKKHYTNGKCLETFKKAKFKTQCEAQPNGDMKLFFPEQEGPSPEIYVDVDDLTKDVRDPSKKMLIDYIITSRDGYKGGAYGDYGGYDIILIKTREPVPEKIQKACLAGKNFLPSRPMIGGYGRYRRVPCEVNDLGPNVYRFCKVDPECSSGTKNYTSAQCKVTFKYEGKSYDKCITDQDTPTKKDPECKSLKDSLKITDKEMTRKDFNEMVIMDEGENVITKCYRENAGRFGWCGLTDQLINGNFSQSKKDFVVTSAAGWGVCTETCTDTEKSFLTGKARIKEVSVIDQDFCEEQLLKTRKGRSPFQVTPKVYCVAYNETYKTKFYKKMGNAYEEVAGSADLHEKVLGRDHPWYIRATGSCKGDSGGPLYEKVGNDFVLLGSTSRGTGKLSNCGGIDNPTHYVRVNELHDWIQTYVKKEDLCIK